MSNSRIKTSIKNMSFGLANQVIVLILNFIARTIFIKILGAEYLGINGLYSNILSVLSLAELGIGNAIIFSLYKPLATKDNKNISAIMNFYRKIYNLIALVVFVIGISIIPFLGNLVKVDGEFDGITLYYILFLLNSVISYLFAYKRTIISADQKNYLLTKYSLSFTLLQFVLQTISLIITKSFTVYLVIQIIMSLLNNIYIAMKADKMYPFLLNREELKKQEKHEIFKSVNSMFLYKIGGVILNNTDNIIISALIGTVWVGYYANYLMLITSVGAFLSIIFTSIYSSIGNLNVTVNLEKKFFIFKVLNLSSYWLYGFSSICIYVLINDFIELWIGKEYLLNNFTVLIIIINFYMVGILTPIFSYRDTTGIFNKTKFISIYTAILNLIFSIILGVEMGLVGVLIATAISRVLTNFWYEPFALYKYYFNKEVKNYYKNQIKAITITIFSACVTMILSDFIVDINVFSFSIKFIICLIVPNIIYFLYFRNTTEFKYIIENTLLKLKK